MKQITVSRCGKCPYFGECGISIDDNYCFKLSREVKKNEIDKSCPLSDMPSREGAITKITVGLMCTGMEPNKANRIAVESANLLYGEEKEGE